MVIPSRTLSQRGSSRRSNQVILAFFTPPWPFFSIHTPTLFLSEQKKLEYCSPRKYWSHSWRRLDCLWHVKLKVHSHVVDRVLVHSPLVLKRYEQQNFLLIATFPVGAWSHVLGQANYSRKSDSLREKNGGERKCSQKIAYQTDECKGTSFYLVLLFAFV